MNPRTQDLEQIAREALGFVPTSGVDGLAQKSRDGLHYGLQHKLFTQKDVDAAQVKFREHTAREALGFVPTSGVDGLAQRSREGLQYGLEHGLFAQKDVDAAQARYVASRRK